MEKRRLDVHTPPPWKRLGNGSVRDGCAALPLGEGVVLDPFAGSGSTLAASEAVGYPIIGLENDPEYFDLACDAIPKLARYTPTAPRPPR